MNPAANRRRGKRVEKKVVDIYKQIDEEIRRLGLLGKEDAVGNFLVIEVKSRKSLPKWMVHAIQQLREDDHPSKICAVHIHQTGKRYIGDVVILTLKTFIRLITTWRRMIDGGDRAVTV